MTDEQRDELITEALLSIRKIQIAYPTAYKEAEATLTAINSLRSRLQVIESDPYYTSYRITQ